ncbi:4-alpha-glucanotransferase [Geotalea toluenoxydans]|uniref:4-alpha-glucanotransferase n=1 Tax=Geotalea toluenoxydans TaxID=421624 RepID=UPI0006CFE2F7|nr:4-alpha-glucanotransferase [Geotalea toluenoxydans]
MQRRRKSGILLHPSSLPGPGGIGSLGEDAYRFVDFLQKADQTMWQILPLGPTAYGNSPYSCYSAFAGNPLLISLESIIDDGDVDSKDLKPNLPSGRVDYSLVQPYKLGVLRKAAARFFKTADQRRKEDFWYFCDNTFWLHDHALFMALKEHYSGKSWCDWPEDIALRKLAAVAEHSEKLGTAIGEHKYMQWQFFRQWQRLKAYTNDRHIEIIGDMPIFVAFDSTDVWANPHLFHLDKKGRPTLVAGVPPDYFSKTGQLWGNPLYNWERVAEEGFSWWVARVRNDLSLYDRVRIDHFRGFEAYWAVPAGEKTAKNGRWVKGPGDALFYALASQLGAVPLIAEDLGVITPEVEALRDKFGFPGMKILQFAFGSGPSNPYLPHNHVQNCAVYTGTHDNDTTSGWFALLKEKEKQDILCYLNIGAENISWNFVRSTLASVADMAIFPLQDILGLDSEARMNVPGVAGGNWSWRFSAEMLDNGVAKRLKALTEMYGRGRSNL